MARRERTEITIETSRVVIVRHRYVVRRWCGGCGYETDFASLEPELHLFESFLAATGQPDLHVGTVENGKRLVCMESLLKASQWALTDRPEKDPQEF